MKNELAGRKFKFSYGDFEVVDAFSETHISYEVISGEFKGVKGEVPYSINQVSDGIYAISWQEPDGATITHVDDLNTGTSLSYFTASDLSFYQMKGTFIELD
ncbi:adenylate cyclase [Vibrio coralliilyticus]|uniref:MoaF-like domain-containing protein n=1 Tax=Vibrio coralliilyticus TaxID=190893 RepID=A0AAN0SCD3_9VIBR|nr:MoaF N-terminal domain-containing protein [Vibrio coralliilyticus]AIW19547.1 hypothetical protein IX92_10955 [Vibrio coralliilyticus]NOH39468.1 adenylate cyclase [Vibrio coralliilyticus]